MKLYVYVMTNDTGFAPCVEDGLLSLACCKGGVNGGMRGAIARDFSTCDKDDIWVLGVCGKGLAAGDFTKEYSPVFLAKVTGTVPMTEYFMPNSEYNGRNDHFAYKSDGEHLTSTEENPHTNADDQKKDIGGKYVILSESFIYWGSLCGNSRGQKLKSDFPGIFEGNDQKQGISKHCRGYMVDRSFEGNFDVYFDGKKIIMHSTTGINQTYIPSDDDNNDEEQVKCFSKCGGKK